MAHKPAWWRMVAARERKTRRQGVNDALRHGSGGVCYRCYYRRNYDTQRVSWLRRTTGPRAIVSRRNAVFRLTLQTYMLFVGSRKIATCRGDIAVFVQEMRHYVDFYRERKLRVLPTRMWETPDRCTSRDRRTTFNLALVKDIYMLRHIRLPIFTTIREARELWNIGFCHISIVTSQSIFPSYSRKKKLSSSFRIIYHSDIMILICVDIVLIFFMLLL